MDKVQTIKETAQDLLLKMIENFEVEVQEDDGLYHVIIKTEDDAPTVIGRHGETIRALQKIIEVILYKSLGEPVSILVNVNDYREKQRERLQGIASQMAEKAQSSKRPSYLRGMSSYERKLIHEYVTENYPELTTYSVGEGKDRQLVINLKGEEAQKEDD